MAPMAEQAQSADASTAEHADAQRVQRVSAYALCVDDRDRLLLCRIAPGATRDVDGWWTLPGGGIEHGEDPRDAALRELGEETGLSGEVGDLVAVDSWSGTFPAWESHPLTSFHAIRIVYRVTNVAGEPRPEVNGTTDLCRWFTRAEAEAEPQLVGLVRAALPHAWPPG